jgi:hypothetical protein
LWNLKRITAAICTPNAGFVLDSEPFSGHIPK